MKLKLFLFMALAGIFFTSCSKDDDKEPVQQVVADKVVGVYEVHTSAAFAYSPKPEENDGDKVTVTKVGDNTVKIIYAGKTWGAGTFEKTTVAAGADGKQYAISGEGTMKMSMKGNDPKDYPATLKADVTDGKKNFSFKITVPSVMGGTVITLTPASTTPQTGK